MKLAIRIFALTIVVTGVVASATAPNNPTSIPNNLSATAHGPIPLCTGRPWPNCMK